MKKFSQSKLGSLFTKIIDIRQWLDWSRVKSFTLYLVNGFSRLFVSQKKAKSESFEAAKTKLHLSDENIMAKQRALFRLSIIMLVSAFLILLYAGYQIYYGSIKAFLVSIVVVLIALVLSFRYHFWYYQMKHHRLGCSFNEWFRRGLLGEKE